VLLKWTDLALIDLEEIESYIAQENSPVVAIDAVIKIIDSVSLILSDHPRAGRQGRVKYTRELVINGTPFVVIYKASASTHCIDVLRVLHSAQRWPTAD
jgi:addiction module RelE/StbE family toxin